MWITSFILIFIYYSRFISNLCINGLSPNFDAQNFLVWMYAATNGVVPYRDISFYYGLLGYYKFNSFLFEILFFGFISAVLATYFIMLRYTFRKAYIYLPLAITLFIFTDVTAGYEVVARYYLAPIVIWLFVILHRSEKLQSKAHFYRYLLLFGLLEGIIFALENDQGIYIVATTTICALLFGKHNIKTLITKSLGFVIGLTPLLCYLIINRSVISFVMALKNLGWMTEFAKSPYYRWLYEPAGVLILLSLFSTSAFCAYHFIFNNTSFLKGSKLYEILFGLLICGFMFQSKNVVRSTISLQIVGVAIFILYIFYAIFRENNLFGFKKIKSVLNIGFLIILLVVPLLLDNSFNRIRSALRSNKQYFLIDFLPSARKGWGYKEVDQCLANNFNKNKLSFFPTYTKIFSYLDNLNKNKKFNIFAFPGEPMLYVFNKQAIPRYLNIYDGSAFTAQQDLIQYMVKNHVNYVIFNTNTGAIQDGVPDILRASYLFKYIVENYTPITSLDSYIIFKKSEKATNIGEILDNPELDSLTGFKNLFVNVPLVSIPMSEGSKLSKNDLLELKSFSPFDINRSSPFIIFIQDKDTQIEGSDVQLELNIGDGRNANVYFNRCNNKNNVCLINPLRLPFLLEKMRVFDIKIIKGVGKVYVLNLSNSDNFW